MNQCQINGCRHLETKCAKCGRLVIEKFLPPMIEWTPISDPPPPMVDVLLLTDYLIRRGRYEDNGYRVVIGWNESTEENEEPSYCSYQDFDEEYLVGWMHFVKPDKKK